MLEGLATGFGIFGLLKLSAGVHTYLVPPDAVSLLSPKVQFTSFDLLNSIEGGGAAVSVKWVIILSQPMLVRSVSI